MKLLFIFTGGTIGSTFDGDFITTDAQKPYRLLSAYQETHSLPLYDTVEPFTMLSENCTGEELSALIECVREHLSDYDGIIITHGTDTLQYTAAALSYAFGISETPICLVSSNFPIEEKAANGIDNLFGAVSLLRSGKHHGVFVSYRNPGDREITIHRGSRLLASEVYSDSFFSIHHRPYGWIHRERGVFTKNPSYKESPDGIPPLSVSSLSGTAGCVLRIVPYPGMCFPTLTESTKAILHESFHSGTVNTASPSAVAFYREARARRIPIFLTGVSKGASYESTKMFKALGLRPLPTIAPIAAYMKLWFSIANGCEPLTTLSQPLGGDF